MASNTFDAALAYNTIMKKYRKRIQINNARKMFSTGAITDTFICGICGRQYQGSPRRAKKLMGLHCMASHHGMKA